MDGLDIPLLENIIRMTIPVLVAFLCGYGINGLIGPRWFLAVACKIVLYSIVYILIMWFFGLNMYEKDLFMSPVKQVVNKIVHSA